MSRPCPWVTLVRPVIWPALVIRWIPWLRAQPIQIVFSFLREMLREMLKPHVSLFGLKFSVRKGIATSNAHPLALRLTRSSQMPSHCRFWPVTPISASDIAPDGFVSKK